MKKTSLFISSIMFSMVFLASSANAAYFTSPSGGANPTYWNKCFEGVGGSGVVAQKFIGSAAQNLNDLGLTQINDVQLPILQKDTESRDAQIAALNGLDEALDIAFKDAYQALSIAEATLEKQALETELEFLKTVNQQSLNEELYGFYSDGNGLNRPQNPNETSAAENPKSTEYKYFKSMCKRGKMISKVSSDTQKIKASQNVHNKTTAKTNSVLSVSSSAQKATSKIQNHYALYCNAYDISNGLCENDELQLCDEDDLEAGVCKADGEKFELANANIDAVNFMSPKYDVDNEAETKIVLLEGFMPAHTYDEEQEAAAYEYADSIVYSTVVQAPTLREKSSSSKSRYVSAYNAYLASLNLAYNSFATAVEKRSPITEEDDPVQMSEIDMMRYMLQNMEDTDSMAATYASKEKGVDMSLYSVMTINNKLELEKLKQKERIKSLLAALVAREANDPDDVEYLESIK